MTKNDKIYRVIIHLSEGTHWYLELEAIKKQISTEDLIIEILDEKFINSDRGENITLNILRNIKMAQKRIKELGLNNNSTPAAGG